MIALVLLLVIVTPACVSASDVLPLLESHVLFATTAAMLWGMGKIATALAPPAARGRAWQLFRRTLPFHPVLTGVALGGLFPHLLPGSVGAGRVAAALYFGASGVLATYGHDVFRTWLKYRNQQ